MPLLKKVDIIGLIYGYKEITVCDDENMAYKYWKEHYNPNKMTVVI